MTSSTEVVLPRDPFPALAELLLPEQGSGRTALDELRERAEAEGWRAGFDEGHVAGIAAGAAEAREVLMARVADVLGRIQAEVAAARSEDAAVVRDIAGAVVDAALEVARAVIGRELAVAESPGRDALVRALAEVSGAGPFIAHLHPDDVELLGEVPSTARAEIDVIADPAVERGGCVLETPTGRVDALLTSAFARAAAALGASEVDAS